MWFLKTQNKIKSQKTKGFTLIELLVSIALFSIVITIILGAIITISDANRKARSLMTVMNNLNFAVDSMTRSFKTGSSPSDSPDNTCFSTTEIDYGSTENVTDVGTRDVKYCLIDGKIIKTVETTATALTSPDIDIESAFFRVSGDNNPILFMNIKGKVQVSPSVSSEFTIQTSVSQR